jgi:hypothetical protein
MRGFLACLRANLPYPAPVLQGRHGFGIDSLVAEKFLAVNRFLNKTKTMPRELGHGKIDYSEYAMTLNPVVG